MTASTAPTASTLKSLTDAEVLAIYAAQRDRVNPPVGWEPWQSTRVLVHLELQHRNPMPCSALTPAMVAARERRMPLTVEEREEQARYQSSQVTDEQHLTFSRAKMSDPNHKETLHAHHYVQKEHGKALWEETDRLVALVKAKVTP
jgi:hypothetical protein